MRVNPDRHIRGVPGLHVLDAATGKTLQTWDDAGHPAGFTAGGKESITFRRGAEITAHDPETGKPARTFKLDGYIASVALSEDGKTVAAVGIAGEGDKQSCEIGLWETATGKEIRALTADPKTVGHNGRLVFAADGKVLYLAAASGRVLRWDLSKGKALADWPVHNGMIADLFLRPNKNELVSSGAWDGAIRRWNAATGESLSKTDAYVGQVAVARMPDGKGMVLVDENGRLETWDLTTGKVTKTLQTPGRKHHQLLFTPDGKKLLVAAQTGQNSVWDLSTGKKIDEFAPEPKIDPKNYDHSWDVLAFSPDGKTLLASKGGHGTWMWTWPDRKILWQEEQEIECCYFTDNETVVSADWHYSTTVRVAQTGKLKRTLERSGAAHIEYSPDRRRAVTAHLDGSWRLRDGSSLRELKEVKGWQYVWCSAFSPSGWLLAVAGDKVVRVYDTASWQEVAHFDGHEGTVKSVFFGPDESTVVSVSGEDGTALVWSLKPPAIRRAPEPAKLWADLAGNGPEIHRAVWAAARQPDVALKLFREKWPVPDHPVKEDRVRKLLDDLDSAEFKVREAAEAELAKSGRSVEALLKKELAGTTSTEVKQRLKRVLDHLAPLEAAEYSPEEARELRAVWALELAGTPEAKNLLEAWATAKVGSRLCEESAAAIKRWKGGSRQTSSRP
jgi:WD40 repeat protein